MSTVFDAAWAIQEECQTRGWQFCFIGGVAVQRWAEPRATVDVDLTILTGFGGEGAVIGQLLERFNGRIEQAAEFAHRNRVLLLKTSDEISVDVSLGAVPYEERMIRRASDHEFIAGQPLILRLWSAVSLTSREVGDGFGGYSHQTHPQLVGSARQAVKATRRRRATR